MAFVHTCVCVCVLIFVEHLLFARSHSWFKGYNSEQNLPSRSFILPLGLHIYGSSSLNVNFCKKYLLNSYLNTEKVNCVLLESGGFIFKQLLKSFFLFIQFILLKGKRR